jgi:hypothetical protein
MNLNGMEYESEDKFKILRQIHEERLRGCDPVNINSAPWSCCNMSDVL